MKPELTKDESAVSEVIGALMIFGIIVGLIGIMQSSQVPVWNAAVEQDHFDRVCSDFVKLRADIEDAEKLKIPKSSDLQMGVRYPERFIFRNPGVGASGTITTYPLNVNVSYSTRSGLRWQNYTSAGIVYEMHGTSESPMLVYEHGLIIKDYGGANITEDEQSLIAGGEVFIPIVLWGDYSFSSMDAQTFNMLPVPQGDCTSASFSRMNVTLETRYPDIWNKSLSGSGFAVSGDAIEITNIPGRRLRLPSNDTSGSTQKQCYVGMIAVDASTATRGPTGPDGIDVWAEGQGRLDIPGSDDVGQFIIRDITLNAVTTDSTLRFVVTDTSDNRWEVEIKFTSSDTIGYVKINGASIGGFTGVSLSALDYQIDLTSYYQGANIGSANILSIEVWDTPDTWGGCGGKKYYRADEDLLYANFLVN
jgi:hypothetical protein